MLLRTADNTMITLRQFPGLYNLTVALTDNGQLSVGNRLGDMPVLHIDLNPKGSFENLPEVKVWDDLVKVQSWSDEANSWFSYFLNFQCKLVRLHPKCHRQVDTRYAIPGQGVHFPDGFPFLVCSEATLEELNSRLNKPVSILRFRPNFVFTGGKAGEEMSWKSLAIGNMRFTSFKPCARCQVIRIHPQTAQLDDEIIPIMTRHYQLGNKILFGVNACLAHPKDSGHVNLGDALVTTT